jgi:uncharacterized membrane protein YphA (DoxX/SURF4 family)
MNAIKTILTNVCRMVMALTFILSGYVKAIDPLGTQYKIQDYLEALSSAGLRAPDWATLAHICGAVGFRVLAGRLPALRHSAPPGIAADTSSC